MGYSSVRNSDFETASKRLESLQYILFITNVIMLLVALANFSVCINTRLQGVHKCDVPSVEFAVLGFLSYELTNYYFNF